MYRESEREKEVQADSVCISQPGLNLSVVREGGTDTNLNHFSFTRLSGYMDHGTETIEKVGILPHNVLDNFLQVVQVSSSLFGKTFLLML